VLSTWFLLKFQDVFRPCYCQHRKFYTKKTYVNIGDEHKNYGYVLEYNNRNSDGFKTIDNSSKNTGFRGNDYVAKFRVNSDADAKYINR
jgi:hypothetical protein